MSQPEQPKRRDVHMSRIRANRLCRIVDIMEALFAAMDAPYVDAATDNAKMERVGELWEQIRVMGASPQERKEAEAFLCRMNAPYSK